MPEWIEQHPDLSVDEREYKRLLGFPHDFVLEGRTRELVEQSRAWFATNGRPWIMVRTVDDLSLRSDRVFVDGDPLSSPELFRRLRESRAEGAAVAVVSAGRECEEHARALWNEGKPDEYFFLEVYGSAVVEHLIAQAAFLLCDWADGEGKAILPHYSPGYPGWNIADQQRLLACIQRNSGESWPGDIRVMDSGMLVPRKSLLALFGIAPISETTRRLTEMVPCERCSLPRCNYRRVPYRHPLPQSESIEHLQPKRTSPSIDTRPPRSVQYSVAITTLAKWARERLTLERHTDGTVQSRFRYQGTTCSDLGRPLEFDYHVRLGTTNDGYVILDASCAPASDDTGHIAMCRYREDGRSFIDEICHERPLLGRPLEEVFGWVRSYAPAGCYCEASSRSHKWGLVYEVIHYALHAVSDPQRTVS